MCGAHTALMAAALMALAVAARGGVPRLELAQVLGRTVCPLAVEVDDDPLRLPRRIQFMRCAREPPRPCACCRARAPSHVAQCVEVFDHVVVQYLPAPDADARNATRSVIQVPVGCSCVLQPATAALQDD